MPEFNEPHKRLTFKLVYYGPAQSGKTTNLMRLHDMLAPDCKGEIMTLETQGDRTLFFDLLPLGFRAPSGALVRLRLFTVPGQVAHDGTRKAVLSRSDGVVFVADSQQVEEQNNAEAFRNLAANVARVGLDFEGMPLVVQFNKRDLPNIVTEDEVRGRWDGAAWPLVFATALTGEGVCETFEQLLRGVFRRYDVDLGLSLNHGLDEETFVTGFLGTSH